MSRYIDADKAIEYFERVHKLTVARFLDAMANDTAADVVSREQYNTLYEENIRLRAELEKMTK